MTEINHEKNQYEQESLATPRSSDLSHDRNIQRNKNRLAGSIVLGIIGVGGLFMAADTLTDTSPQSGLPPVVEVIAELGLGVINIGMAIPIGLEAHNNLKAYDL